MDDSADMNAQLKSDVDAATRRLRTAIDSLASRVRPLGDDMARLRKELASAQTLSSDRADLAAQLDQVTLEARTAQDALESKEREHAARERAFAELAQDTDSQLDAIRNRVADALGDGGTV